MSFERITMDRALDEMKAGHEVYRLFPADLSISLAEWLTECFVIEEDPPAPVIGDCPPSGPEKAKPQKAAGTKRKTLDWGKIQALHNAGWSHAKIADEVGATAGTISSGLLKLRKEGQNGKEQSGETDAGAEEADHGCGAGGE